jgi:hypothetical protein
VKEARVHQNMARVLQNMVRVLQNMVRVLQNMVRVLQNMVRRHLVLHRMALEEVDSQIVVVVVEHLEAASLLLLDFHQTMSEEEASLNS